jgi:hypothetical protein
VISAPREDYEPPKAEEIETDGRPLDTAPGLTD